MNGIRIDTDQSYNGWKNRQTWNVALWINNDEGLYRSACQYMRDPRGRGRPYKGRAPYADFAARLAAEGIDRTPDGVRYDDSRLSRRELNAMLRELVS